MSKKIKRTNNRKMTKKNKKQNKNFIEKKAINSITTNNSFSKICLKLTDIEIKIINHVKKNESKLNYFYEDEAIIKLNKEILDKVKDSCLCRVSDEFGTAVCIDNKGYFNMLSYSSSF